ncbi:MAG: ABC transporter substrate-binding protein [Alphaproteobacteria bacterium]|nr:ABC transporter substrate-binding protein [Alphaproteobacteria bacterium]
MRRREFVGSLGGLAVAGPVRLARAQPSNNRRKIGYLHPAGLDGTFIFTLLQSRWRELGYVEGETVLLRSAQGDLARLPTLAAELVGLGADVLVAVGLPAIKAALSARPAKPVVAMDLESDPVKAGLVGSWAKPGGNLTGLFLDQASLTGKWLDLLRQVDPGVKRIALAWDPDIGSGQLEAAQTAARAFGLESLTLTVRRPEEFEAVFAALTDVTGTAVVLLGSPTLATPARYFAEAVLKRKLPAMAYFKPLAKAGTLMTYGAMVESYFPRAISMAHQILNGAKASEIPIEGPVQFELVVNMKTAKTLGLTIPGTLQAAADELIE